MLLGPTGTTDSLSLSHGEKRKETFVSELEVQLWCFGACAIGGLLEDWPLNVSEWQAQWDGKAMPHLPPNTYGKNNERAWLRTDGSTT